MRNSDRTVEPGALVAFDVSTRVEQERSEGREHRHKEVHVRSKVQDAMTEGCENAQGRERRLGVVAQILGIPEEETGSGVVIGIPGGQRDDATREPRGFAPELEARWSAAAEAFNDIDCDQCERDGDRGFFR